MLLTVKDVAHELQVKPSTLYAWVAERKIPCVKLHGLIRFRREDINEWLESLRKQRANPFFVEAGERGVRDIDSVIARAKRQVYSSCPGDQTKAAKKGG